MAICLATLCGCKQTDSTSTSITYSNKGEWVSENNNQQNNNEEKNEEDTLMEALFGDDFKPIDTSGNSESSVETYKTAVIIYGNGETFKIQYKNYVRMSCDGFYTIDNFSYLVYECLQSHLVLPDDSFFSLDGARILSIEENGTITATLWRDAPYESERTYFATIAVK